MSLFSDLPRLTPTWTSASLHQLKLRLLTFLHTHQLLSTQEFQLDKSWTDRHRHMIWMFGPWTDFFVVVGSCQRNKKKVSAANSWNHLDRSDLLHQRPCFGCFYLSCLYTRPIWQLIYVSYKKSHKKYNFTVIPLRSTSVRFVVKTNKGFTNVLYIYIVHIYTVYLYILCIYTLYIYIYTLSLHIWFVCMYIYLYTV